MIQVADIVFTCRKNNIISKAIAWFTRSRFSHTMLVHEITERDVYLSEASFLGVQFDVLDKFITDPNIRVEVLRKEGLSDHDKLLIAESAYCYSKNEAYGYFQLFSFAIKELLKKFSIYIKNFIRQGVVCNEYVTYGYKLANIEGFSDIDVENYTPQDLYEYCIQLGFKQVYVKDF